MQRENLLTKMRENKDSGFDIIIAGGGATGLGAGVDAASRGYKTLLVEALDFTSGTSSRSTKLIHGGVRYLQQGNITLVMESLHERGVLSRNAPHLIRHQSFIVPQYEWWEGPFYGTGHLPSKWHLAPKHGPPQWRLFPVGWLWRLWLRFR